MIADRLPERRTVFLHQFEAAHPFRAFAKIEVRHKQACWATMLGSERTSVVFVNHLRFSAPNVGERQIRGVAAVAKSNDIANGGLRIKVNAFEQRVDRNARPDGIEL